jgi:hypothetical protein
MAKKKAVPKKKAAPRKKASGAKRPAPPLVNWKALYADPTIVAALKKEPIFRILKDDNPKKRDQRINGIARVRRPFVAFDNGVLRDAKGDEILRVDDPDFDQLLIGADTVHIAANSASPVEYFDIGFPKIVIAARRIQVLGTNANWRFQADWFAKGSCELSLLTPELVGQVRVYAAATGGGSSPKRMWVVGNKSPFNGFGARVPYDKANGFRQNWPKSWPAAQLTAGSELHWAARFAYQAAVILYEKGKKEQAISILAWVAEATNAGADLWDLNRQATDLLARINRGLVSRSMVPLLNQNFYQQQFEKRLENLGDMQRAVDTLGTKVQTREQLSREADLQLSRFDDLDEFNSFILRQNTQKLDAANRAYKKLKNMLQKQQREVNRGRKDFDDAVDAYRTRKIIEAAISVVTGVAGLFAGRFQPTEIGQQFEEMNRMMKVLNQLAKAMEVLNTLANVAGIASQLRMDMTAIDSISNAAIAKIGRNINDFAQNLNKLPDDTQWTVFENSYTASLAPLKSEISATHKYLNQLDDLVAYGRALTATTRELAELQNERNKFVLQRAIDRRQRQRLADYKREQQELARQQQMVYLSVNDSYREYLLWMNDFLEAYNRAYEYWSLRDSVLELPAQPELGDIENVFKRLQTQFQRGLEALYHSDGSRPRIVTEGYTRVIRGEEELKAFRNGRPVLFTVYRGNVSSWERVRVKNVKIEPIGLQDAGKNFMAYATTYGEYRDYVIHPRRKSYRFFGPRWRTQSRCKLLASGTRHLPQTSPDDWYFDPTIFTTWEISLSKDGTSKGLDLKKLSKLKVTFDFEATATGT